MHFLKEKNTDSAYHYYKKGYQLFKNKKLFNIKINRINKISHLLDYSYVLIQEDSLNKAINKLERVLDSLNHFINDYSRDEKNLFLKTYEFLIDAYTRKEKYDNALTSSQKINSYLNTYNKKI